MKSKKRSIAILVSGGFDSNILLAKASQNPHHIVYPIYIAGGFNWEAAELFWLKKYLRSQIAVNLMPLKILSLPMRDLLPQHYGFKAKLVPDLKSADAQVEIPGRNLMLVGKTSVYCQQNNIQEIWLGTLKGNPFADSSRGFFSLFEQLIKAGLNYHLKIKTPFAKKTKAQVLKLGKDLPLHLCFTCLRPNKKFQACNNCNKCAERMKFYAKL